MAGTYSTNSTGDAPAPTKDSLRVSGDHDHYRGLPDDLVAAGVIPRIDVLPGQPGRQKTVCTYDVDWQPITGRQMWSGDHGGWAIFKRTSGTFQVLFHESKEERQEREAHEAAAHSEEEWAQRLSQNDSDATKRQIAQLGQSLTAWLLYSLHDIPEAADVERSKTWWRYGSAQSRKHFNFLRELVAFLEDAAEAPMFPGPAVEQPRQSSAPVQTADPGFQRFLQRTVGK